VSEILVVREEITITRAEYPAGSDVAGSHVHHDQTIERVLFG
jgi:hypothetical protein